MNIKCKYFKDLEKWYMIKEYDPIIVHDIIKFNIINEEYENDRLNIYNMIYKKYQNIMLKVLFSNNQIKNNNYIYFKFKNKFKCKFK